MEYAKISRIAERTVSRMNDEYIRLDTTIIAIDHLINEAATGTMARTLFKAKDAIYSQQKYAADVQPVNQWISVDDRLPEEIGYYLVVIGNEMLISIDIAEYSEGYWHKHDKVLYWQPLPELPKEG